MKSEIESFAGCASIIPADLAKDPEVERLFEEISSRFSRLDTLVNNSFSPSQKEHARSERILHPQDVADTIFAALTLPERAMVSEIDIRPANPR